MTAYKKESDVFHVDKNKLFTKSSEGELVARLFKGDSLIIAGEDRLRAMKEHSEKNDIIPDISAGALAAIEKMAAEQVAARKMTLRGAFAPAAAKQEPRADTVSLADLKNPEVAQEIRRQGRLAKLGVAQHS